MKPKIVLLLTLFSISQIVSAQLSEKEYSDPISFAVVEEKPLYPGGDAALMRFISKNTRYPELARLREVHGRVFIEFIIDKEGNVGNVRLVKKVNPLLDREALRVIRLLPAWTPGRHDGKMVAVRFVVPVNFKLE